jgi:hypothetical protein
MDGYIHRSGTSDRIRIPEEAENQKFTIDSQADYVNE